MQILFTRTMERAHEEHTRLLELCKQGAAEKLQNSSASISCLPAMRWSTICKASKAINCACVTATK
jgi:hypothetical protein